MKRGRNSLKTGQILMWKVERMGRIKRKHNTDTDETKGDREGQNSREEHNRRAENRREPTETDGDRRRMFENKFYVTDVDMILLRNKGCRSNRKRVAEMISQWF